MMVKGIAIGLTGISISLCLYAADEAKMRAQKQADKQKREAVLCESRFIRDKFRILMHTMTVDEAYTIAYSNKRVQKAKAVGEKLAVSLLDWDTLKDAHKIRTNCYFALYADGRAKTTDDIERVGARKLSLSQRISSPDLWKTVMCGDDTLQETNKICQGVVAALHAYRQLSKPKKIAHAHIAYAYHLGRAWRSSFLTHDVLRDDENFLNQQGRLHNSKRPLEDWGQDIIKHHLPTILNAQKQRRLANRSRE